jgi:starvation-inducible DNA-binding protein
MATATAQKKSSPESQLFATRIDIPEDRRIKLIAILNQQLADTSDLRSQVKHCHWNVKGPNFIGLHKLFDELAERLDDAIDDIGERITALGGLAVGSLKAVARASRLAEFPPEIVSAHELEQALADRYALLAKSTREAIDMADDLGDLDTADLFTGISRVLDKDLWFIEAHLQSKG